jgi:hypothetical protein
MRCLIITPKRFYLFHEFLAQALERRGYEVHVVNDEYPENIIGVLLGNFCPPLSKLLTLGFFRKYLPTKGMYDLVVIVKGRGISVKTINCLREHAKRIIGYNFDSFQYNPSPLQWMKKVDKYATFDHRDSQEHGLVKIELFASVTEIENTDKTVDLSVILKNHSDRLLYLDQISSLFSKIKSEIFIYERNILTFVKNFVLHPLLMIKWRKYISFKSMNYSSYLDMINRSKFTLDFAHPKQTGTTIRCFEALACKTKIISNNKFILTNPVFNENNVIIHPLGGNVVELYHHMKEKSKMAGGFNSRSIHEFVDELLR